MLENSKGLSYNALLELQSQLEEKIDQLKGEEMIFQLAQLVQEFLHLYNKPASKSFYDEMLQRQKEKEEKDLQAKQMEEDRQVFLYKLHSGLIFIDIFFYSASICWRK